MGKQRTWTDDDLIKFCSESESVTEVLHKLGLKDGGGSRTNTMKHIARLGIDISHYPGQAWWRGKKGEIGPQWKPDSEIFKMDVPSTTNTRRRFLSLVEYKCVECGISEWNNKPLILHMDHIDGNRMNNVLENLRLLCPNCHAQTETYSRRKAVLEVCK
jgi:hypothetical protein